MRLRLIAFVLAFGTALALGCQGPHRGPFEYQTLPENPNRDTETARRENGRAVAFIQKGDLDKAEKALKAALAADVFFGPAHNNLGVVHQKREQYYLAAWEFQYAVKLMPYSPEPRSNLGLVYETVGRLEDAEGWYDKALGLQPDNPQLIGNLARLRVRAGEMDEKTRRLLADLALKDTRPAWAAWAREHLALLRPAEVPVSAGPGVPPALVPSAPSVPSPLPAQPPKKPAQP